MPRSGARAAAPAAAPSQKGRTGSLLVDSGAGADSGFAEQPAAGPVQPCRRKTWVGIELKDTNGRPTEGEAYRIRLPDGRMVEGTLDGMGTAGVMGIDPGTASVSFPNLDAKDWKQL